MIARLVLLYFLLVNLWAYGRMALEERRAAGAWGVAVRLLLGGRRLPEAELYRLAWLGGAPGILLAVRRFRPGEAGTRLVRIVLSALTVEGAALLLLLRPGLGAKLVEALGLVATALGSDLQLALAYLRLHAGLP
ncbi:MAG: DUF1294 domain-containing protein [Clostridia bacterium]|nr:DUF1294 domain-containing protein [Clostridia bacterium]